MKIGGTFDEPEAGARVYGECISIRGTIVCQPHDGARIRAWLDDELIGGTEVLFRLTSGFGFSFLARANASNERSAEIRLTVSTRSQPGEEEFGRRAVQLISSRLNEKPYSGLADANQTSVLHRENIYGSGPPAEVASGEVLQLIKQYLDPQSSIVDVGCGAGSYSTLTKSGYRWLGLELDPICLRLLAEKRLPHREIPRPFESLPCAGAEFDHAICIEVLEHISDVDRFLREIARCIRGRALFSVPNMEVLPYFSAWLVAPWHILEADHKNFFTRASLRELLRKHFRAVEVFSYGEHPLRTPDGISLHYHLFAVATND